MKLISLKEASIISGKTERTLRDWIKRRIINDYRQEGQIRSPIVIDADELKGHLSRLSTPPQKTSAETSTSSTGNDNLINVMREQITLLESVVKELRHEKEQLKVEVSDSRKVIQSLQAELAGRKGVRGLLKAFWS
jgi:predicted RNase H-like nuclease (RuvC/YqgF family)